MKQHKSAILFLLFIMMMIGQACVTLKGNIPNGTKLTSGNLNSINGRYSIKKIDTTKSSRYWPYNNLMTELDRRVLRDTLHLDSHQNHSVKFEVVNEKSLLLHYYENDEIVRERKVKFKLKQDGYLYLKNKNFVPVLIPYVFGWIDLKKARITTDLAGNLVFDVGHHSSGAIGLIGFLDGRTWKYTHIYPLLKKTQAPY